MIKPSTLRIILTLAITKEWIIRHVGINNSVLNGELEDTVFMNQPEGFEDESKPNHICKLEKALYGLKQAPKA